MMELLKRMHAVFTDNGLCLANFEDLISAVTKTGTHNSFRSLLLDHCVHNLHNRQLLAEPGEVPNMLSACLCVIGLLSCHDRSSGQERLRCLNSFIARFNIYRIMFVIKWLGERTSVVMNTNSSSGRHIFAAARIILSSVAVIPPATKMNHLCLSGGTADFVDL